MKHEPRHLCVCVLGGGGCLVPKRAVSMLNMLGERGAVHAFCGSKWEVSMTDSRSAILPVQVGMEFHLDQPAVFTTVCHQTKCTDRRFQSTTFHPICMHFSLHMC